MHFTVIHSGLIKIVRSVAGGREAIVGLFGPRESIGEVAVVRGTTYPGGAVVCSESATVIQIPRATFMGWLQSSAEIALRMTQGLGERLQALHTKLDILSAGGVEARLAWLLRDLAQRFGDEMQDGSILIPIALSRRELANLVSTTFETAIRTMSRLQKRGILETQPDGFVVRDMAALEQAARASSE